jgi:hypothetical protein
VYVEYQSGPRELYDLRSDPYQLENIYATADPANIAALSARLAELATSQGDPPYLPGDHNGNGAVEQADLDLVLLHWGQTAGTVPPTWIGPQPMGHIDQSELDAVLLNWGAMSAASAAPRQAPLVEAAYKDAAAVKVVNLRPVSEGELPQSKPAIGNRARFIASLRVLPQAIDTAVAELDRGGNRLPLVLSSLM